MEIDREGHIVITPKEAQAAIKADRTNFINNIWLAGTPWIFDTYEKYSRFLRHLSDKLGVHPRNIVFRGSTKFGFSIAPDADKVWRSIEPDSDIDLGIVDPDYYHFFDREFRHYDRMAGSAIMKGDAYRRTLGRRKTRRHYTYRYFDFPNIECVTALRTCLREAPVAQCCRSDYDLDAFVYRDWWCVHSRCELDLIELIEKLGTRGFPQGEDTPRSRDLTPASDEGHGLMRASSLARTCDQCGGQLRQNADNTYTCPSCATTAAPSAASLPPS